MKVLVVDDHALIREALHGVLTELVEAAIVLEASDCRQAARLIVPFRGLKPSPSGEGQGR